LSLKRQRLSAEERRKQILTSTYKLIALKGFKSVTTRMIAKEVGINEALIFRYFNNKENLLNVVVSDLKSRRPSFNILLPNNEKEFFNTLKEFEDFFLNLNCKDPSILKIILYAILENYPVPEEFNINSKGTFLNWILCSIKKGKSEWEFNQKVNEIEAICIYMGGLIYYVLETSVIKQIQKLNNNSFTELFFKVLK